MKKLSKKIPPSHHEHEQNNANHQINQYLLPVGARYYPQRHRSELEKRDSKRTSKDEGLKMNHKEATT